MSMSDPSRCQRSPSHPRTLHNQDLGGTPCQDAALISIVQGICLRRACARDQMNLVLTNLKPRANQCTVCVKLRDGVVSRLVQQKHKFICTFSAVQFVVPLATDQGVVAAGKSVKIIRNQQIITRSPSNSSSPSPVQITSSSLPPDRALSPRCEISVSVPAPPFMVSFPHASDRWSCQSPPNT